jgi:hypothetical protein
MFHLLLVRRLSPEPGLTPSPVKPRHFAGVRIANFGHVN